MTTLIGRQTTREWADAERFCARRALEEAAYNEKISAILILVKNLRDMAGKYDEYGCHADLELCAADAIEFLLPK